MSSNEMFQEMVKISIQRSTSSVAIEARTSIDQNFGIGAMISSLPNREERLSEKIALRLISLGSDGVMLPKTDGEIIDRQDQYRDLLDGRPISKWVAAEVYAYLRGYKKATSKHYNLTNK